MKFWSVAILRQRLVMSGFTVRAVARVGRTPAVVKSMAIRAVKVG